MIKDNKGSALIWAVTLVLVLMVIVGASLTFSEINYNQSVANKNQTQADLTADSAIKSVVALVETKTYNDKIIPTTVNDSQSITDLKFTGTTGIYGNISDIKITRSSETEILIELQVKYKNRNSNAKATMITPNEGVNWVISKYDSNTEISYVYGGGNLC